ncbi:MAG: ABC transporter permease, partial [Terriglobales bacterium]
FALTVAACALGAVLSFVILRLLAVEIPRFGFSLPFLTLPRVDAHLFLPLAAFAVIAAVAWTLLLLVRERRQNVWRSLASPGDDISWRRRRLSITSVAVVAQTAVSVVLAVVAVAAVTAFAAKSSVNLGPEPDHLYSFHPGYDGHDSVLATDAGTRRFMQSLSTRMAAVPGTQAVAYAEEFPPAPEPESYQALRGAAKLPSQAATSPQIVSASYFATVGMPLRSGRNFSPADAKGSSVAIVNQAFADEFWPEHDALGQRFITQHNNTFTVVGITGDFGGYWLDASAPQVYIPESRELDPGTIIVRSRAPGGRVAAAVRGIAEQLDPNPTLTLDGGHSLEYAWAATVTRPRLQMFAMLLFALLAVLLAVQGIFAAVSLAVRTRRRESAIRLVLGASRRSLAWTLVSGTTAFTVTGFALGCLALLLMQGELSARVALAPATLWSIAVPAAAAVLALVLAAGSYFPLRRSRHVQPMDTLREG